MENDSLVHPNGKFPEKVELLKRYSRFPGWNVPNGFLCSITTILEFHTSSRSTERNLSRSFGEKRPSSQWISLQFVFSVLTKWNSFHIMNAFLLEVVGMWCLK